MKIAVCLSGQPRSIEYCTTSILSYFDSKEYEVDYFCHAWDYNTWKCKGDVSVMFGDYEPVDRNYLIEQINRYNPKEFYIGGIDKIQPKYNNIPWGSLFYSMMMANHLKIKFELQNNFRYDYVVKARYDLVFEPGIKFSPEPYVHDRQLYFNHRGRMHYRYNIVNASDPIFYGDTWGMDIIADSFLYLKRHYSNPYNLRADQLGGYDPGTFIYQQALKHNINVEVDKRNPGDIIYRKEMIPTDPFKDFESIRQNHASYYQIIL